MTVGTGSLSKNALKRRKLDDTINAFKSSVNRKNLNDAIEVMEWAIKILSMGSQEINNRKNNIPHLKTEKGQVYEADMGKGIGNEQSGTRPVVIIEEDDIPDIISTVTVVPLTSALRRDGTEKPVFDCRTRFQSANLGGDSLAKCDQIVTISKSRLGQFKCQLEDPHIKSIDEALERHVKFTHKIQ
jgi:mRNA-degrading endonuclease toxin of MazEF toxin-antitoxin module